MAYVPDLLYHYRCRPGSITQRPVDHQTVRDTLLMLEEMTAWMAARHPDMGSEFDRFHSAARLHVLYRLAAGRQVDPTLWDPMVAWLDQNSRRLRVNPHLSKRTKVAISLLVRGGHLGRALVGVARRHQGR